jgi:hypothetical protein
MTQRALRGRRLLLVGAILVPATLYFGLTGWRALGIEGWGNRLYLTLLAFTGDPIYVSNLRPCTPVPTDMPPPPDIFPPPCAPPLPFELTIARVTGFATTVLAIAGLLSLALADRLNRFRAGRRTKHAVLIGPTPFGLDRLRREVPGLPITVIGTTATEPGPGTLHLPVDPDDTETVQRLLGKPVKVLFGEREPLRNIARAQALLPTLEGAELLVRVEDLSLVRDLGLLAPELAKAEAVSSSEAVAEAVVFALSAPELAELRGQPGVHVVMVGLGTTGLAIAEQLAATCQRVDDQGGVHRPRLTVLDVDAAVTEARIDGQSPGLRSVATLTVHDMDGQACQTRPCLDRLREIEAMQPVTAIVVATGDDARNAAIGMRLRQIQCERLLFKAPILVRNRMAIGKAPAAINDISGGTYAFGGNRSGPQDPDLVVFEEELGEALHTGWRQTMMRSSAGPQGLGAPKPWGKLASAEKRSSLIAARAAPHILRVAGLVPDPGTSEAGMRVHHAAVKSVADQKPVLGKLEHERWIAEKKLDGWTCGTDRYGHTQPRDDERKIHTALVGWNEIDAENQKKDLDNIGILIRTCEIRWQRGGPAWRRRFRVGVMGPLDPGGDAMRLIKDAFAAYLRSWSGDIPLEATSLEILTPDAPGFDRVAPVALLSAWERCVEGAARGSCRVVALRAGGRDLLDAKAADHLADRMSGMELARDGVAAQTRAFDKACTTRDGKNILRTADLRPPDVSDADLLGDDALWTAGLAQVEEQIDALSDLLVWGRRPDGGGRSARIADRRAELGRGCLPVDLG